MCIAIVWLFAHCLTSTGTCDSTRTPSSLFGLGYAYELHSPALSLALATIPTPRATRVVLKSPLLGILVRTDAAEASARTPFQLYVHVEMNGPGRTTS